MRGEGRVFLRGKMWWLAYWGPVKGEWQEIRESSKSESETTARKILAQRIREVENHRGGIRAFQGPKQSRLTVGDLLDSLKADYERRAIKSIRTALIHMQPVREYFGHMRAIGVTPDHVRNFIAEQQALKLSNATVNRRIEILSAAYTLALKDEQIGRAS